MAKLLHEWGEDPQRYRLVQTMTRAELQAMRTEVSEYMPGQCFRIEIRGRDLLGGEKWEQTQGDPYWVGVLASAVLSLIGQEAAK